MQLSESVYLLAFTRSSVRGDKRHIFSFGFKEEKEEAEKNMEARKPAIHRMQLVEVFPVPCERS